MEYTMLWPTASNFAISEILGGLFWISKIFLIITIIIVLLISVIAILQCLWGKQQ